MGVARVIPNKLADSIHAPDGNNVCLAASMGGNGRLSLLGLTGTTA